jgi:hypothetical protein
MYIHLYGPNNILCPEEKLFVETLYRVKIELSNLNVVKCMRKPNSQKIEQKIKNYLPTTFVVDS